MVPKCIYNYLTQLLPNNFNPALYLLPVLLDKVHLPLVQLKAQLSPHHGELILFCSGIFKDRNIHRNCFIIPLLGLPFHRLSFIQIILSSIQIILSFISGTLRYLCKGESGDRGTAYTLNDSVFCVFCKVMEMTLATSTTLLFKFNGSVYHIL